MNSFIQWVVINVYSWLINPQVWSTPGPIAQMIFVLLLFYDLLTALPPSLAGGSLFDRKACWIALTATAIYILVVFVVPFVSINIQFAVPFLALLVFVLIATFAVMAFKKWH